MANLKFSRLVFSILWVVITATQGVYAFCKGCVLFIMQAILRDSGYYSSTGGFVDAYTNIHNNYGVDSPEWELYCNSSLWFTPMVRGLVVFIIMCLLANMILKTTTKKKHDAKKRHA